ncbi:MAG: dephospho-CoA kinase [Deltaproteobacteria bacterium]|nr:dephospho-CoA kinase [Deltaproteobacteria bacterium]
MGKSTVADIFRSLGALIVDSDAIARSYLNKGMEGYERVVEHWGRTILDNDYGIDRGKLAGIVFRDTAERKWLESIVHPYVFGIIGHEIEINRDREGIMIIEVPLLFETNADAWLRPVILVVCGRDAQIERLRRRDPRISYERIADRLRAQMPIEQKQKSADFIVDNSGDVENTARQTKNIWNTLKDGEYEQKY